MRAGQGAALSLYVFTECVVDFPIQTVAMTIRLEIHEKVKVTDPPANSTLLTSQK